MESIVSCPVVPVYLKAESEYLLEDAKASQDAEVTEDLAEEGCRSVVK